MARSKRSEVSLAEMAYARAVSYTPVTDTSAYAAGDMIGTGASALTLFGSEQRKSGLVVGCLVHDYDKQNASLDILLLSANPTSSTFTNNAVLALHDNDFANVIGIIKVYSSDYVSLSAQGIAQTTGTLAYPVASGATVYAVTRCGGTPTYTAADSLTITLVLCED